MLDKAIAHRLVSTWSNITIFKWVWWKSIVLELLLCTVWGTHTAANFHMIPGWLDSQSKIFWSWCNLYYQGWFAASLSYAGFSNYFALFHFNTNLSIQYGHMLNETTVKYLVWTWKYVVILEQMLNIMYDCFNKNAKSRKIPWLIECFWKQSITWSVLEPFCFLLATLLCNTISLVICLCLSLHYFLT